MKGFLLFLFLYCFTAGAQPYADPYEFKPTSLSVSRKTYFFSLDILHAAGGGGIANIILLIPVRIICLYPHLPPPPPVIPVLFFFSPTARLDPQEFFAPRPAPPGNRGGWGVARTARTPPGRWPNTGTVFKTRTR